KKAHERQAVADQVLSLLIREIVERLQHHDLELQDRIVGLATSVALALLGLSTHRVCSVDGRGPYSTRRVQTCHIERHPPLITRLQPVVTLRFCRVVAQPY